jgi:hypothetical protein
VAEAKAIQAAPEYGQQSHKSAGSEEMWEKVLQVPFINMTFLIGPSGCHTVYIERWPDMYEVSNPL